MTEGDLGDTLVPEPMSNCALKFLLDRFWDILYRRLLGLGTENPSVSGYDLEGQPLQS